MADYINIPLGATFESSQLVTENDSAKRYGSGLVDVFATPAMIALMENACLNAVAPFLPVGYGTVGVEVNVTHTKPTPIGGHVVCKASLVSIDGRRLQFEVIANDDDGEIGKGSHSRFIVDMDKFLQKLKK